MNRAEELLTKYQAIENQLDQAWGNEEEINRVNVRLSEIKSDIVSIAGLRWFEENI